MNPIHLCCSVSQSSLHLKNPVVRCWRESDESSRGFSSSREQRTSVRGGTLSKTALLGLTEEEVARGKALDQWGWAGCDFRSALSTGSHWRFCVTDYFTGSRQCDHLWKISVILAHLATVLVGLVEYADDLHKWQILALMKNSKKIRISSNI